MRLAFLIARQPRSWVSPVMPEVVRLLREWGVEVTLIHPEEELVNLRDVHVEHDLYVLKSGTELALGVAGALDALGAAVVNPYAATLRCRDKVVATRLLQAAGVPVPETFLSAHPARLAPLLDAGPLVVKPSRGSGGRGVHVVRGPDDLRRLPTGEPVFAQRYQERKGRDRKIYCIGGQLFGVKRVWPVRTYEEKLGEPFTVEPALRDVALRCASALGLELFGLDVVETAGGPYVVDVNAFPGFKGVPDAALRLADYIYAVAHRGAVPAFEVTR